MLRWGLRVPPGVFDLEDEDFRVEELLRPDDFLEDDDFLDEDLL